MSSSDDADPCERGKKERLISALAKRDVTFLEDLAEDSNIWLCRLARHSREQLVVVKAVEAQRLHRGELLAALHARHESIVPLVMHFSAHGYVLFVFAYESGRHDLFDGMYGYTGGDVIDAAFSNRTNWNKMERWIARRASHEFEGAEARVAHLFAQMARALFYLHNTLGVAHRDIKPENVILSADRTRAYLIDFGLCFWTRAPPPPPHEGVTGGDATFAVPMDPDTKPLHRKRRHSAEWHPESSTLVHRLDVPSTMHPAVCLVGTRGYIAPEIGVSRMVSWDALLFAADVFSLGLVLCEMLFGVGPYWDCDMLRRCMAESRKPRSERRLWHDRRWLAELHGACVPDWLGGSRPVRASVVASACGVHVQAVRLVRAMTSVYPWKRPTIDRVLRHPWLRAMGAATHVRDVILKAPHPPPDRISDPKRSKCPSPKHPQRKRNKPCRTKRHLGHTNSPR